MPKKKVRREIDNAALKAEIISLLERRYGENGEEVPQLGLPDDEKIARRVRELIKFYKTPYPDAKGRSPQMNIWYVMAPSGYAKDANELNRLLMEDIAAAKRPATKFSRENRALQLISEIFDQGWQRDRETGEIIWAEPYKPKKPTPEEEAKRLEQVRMMANAMWRRGSRDS